MAARKRKIDLDRVRSRLYELALEGNPRQAVPAARLLLQEHNEDLRDKADKGVLDQLAKIMNDEE